ncbi:hypothetical protein EV202_1021 [Bacteroides heparinolyticus]|uniref:Uncharacterized protein n=1 Tax=Prevotella heparinolytica TaxID=28113 RepID=A0A4R2LWN1_9BACE|nr:hypothetical protein [Bacteroides heparinolyticus]TCO95903.1 hypothetical protein EV202_1021 [Bacteroides heparinolyticus]
MTVHDRIKLAVKWLIGTGVANNQEAIGRLMGYSNKSSFSQILNNKVSIPADFIDRLCELNENINKVWIESEKGNMLRTDTVLAPSDSTVVSKELSQSDIVILRLIDKLDEKDALLKEKDAKIDELQSELRRQSAELAALKALRNKEKEYQSGFGGVVDTFAAEPSPDYGGGFSNTNPPPVSKKSSVGKMHKP